jgi:cytochrome P450
VALPPGPNLPAPVQAIAYHRDPLGVLERARAAHGPVFTLMLKGPVVFVTDPELARELAEDAHAGNARRAILPQASPHSPFGADGSEWRAVREQFEPRLEALDEERIAAIAEAHIGTWPSRRPFRLLERMRDIATDVFGQLILGIDDPAYVRAVRRMLNTPGNPPLPVPDLKPVFEWRLRPLKQCLRHHGHSDDEIDRLIVVIAAAQEPGAIGLTNVVYERACDDTVTVDEALRRRPPASALLRQPPSVAGYDLPPGTPVALPLPLLHRHGLFLPFGDGPRRCLGEPLARAELNVIPPLTPALKPAWPRTERMVVRGTVLVPHRSALVSATGAPPAAA